MAKIGDWTRPSRKEVLRNAKDEVEGITPPCGEYHMRLFSCLGVVKKKIIQ